MTVTSQTTKITTTGNGSATTFSFSPIVIFASTELEVTTTVIATGVETSRSEGTGASAWSIGISDYPATGSITYPEDKVTPLPATETITIKRVLTLEQQTDLENQGGYFPDIQETQFDKLVMIDLQQQEGIDRSLKFPVSYTGNVVTEVPAPVAADAGKALALNAGLTAFEFIDSTGPTGAQGPQGLPGDMTNPMTARGDIITGDSAGPGNPQRLAVGTNGQYLTTDGTDVSWADAASGGAWTFIETLTASASTSLDSEATSAYDGTYDEIVFVLTDILPATDSVDFYMRVKDITYQAGATDYEFAIQGTSSVGGSVLNNSSGVGQIPLSAASAGYHIGSGAAEGINGWVTLCNPSSTTRNKNFKVITSWWTDAATSEYITIHGAGSYNGSTNAITGVRFLMSSGNIASGTIRVYGVNKS